MNLDCQIRFLSLLDARVCIMVQEYENKGLLNCDVG